MTPDILPLMAGLFGAGMLAGLIAGLLGVGGGIVTIPPLFIALGVIGVPDAWHMHMAVATSLVIIVATNMSSVYAHHRKGGVDWAVVKDWWWVLAIMAFIGSKFAETLKTRELVFIFAGLAALLALKMILPLDRFRVKGGLPTGLGRFIGPAVIGFFSAVMGIGGGSFSVPFLTIHGMPIWRAVGTSSLAGLVISLAGGIGYLTAGSGITGMPAGTVGFVYLPAAGLMAVASVITAPLGAKLAHKLPKQVLSIIFGLFLVLATCRMLSAVL
ncbi:sulfite exporter TauE/SafE family protein [Pseudokordiimonas caeni]|uniref:sulfite exporter TauE/SafE family protein n=1 Tax=Pseudokordiimonas caeni TaxID=2997908 RepID=UPI002810E3F1|nr:sulfite exporter TauE/SafE family protein [Pseudokordiimonas caeni]